MQTRGGAIEPRFPDVLQVFKEGAADILNLATVAGLEIEDVFPYGFVVSNATTDETRWLPANPAEGDFHGLVTFAYKVPLQADPKDDPFTVTIRFLAVEDSEVKITQSIEEVTPAGIKAFDERVATLWPSEIRLLPWGATAAPSYERFCSVRSAGPASNPTAYIATCPGASSLSPAPYTGSASSLPPTTQFTAQFDRAVNGVSAKNFVVHGSQSGRRFAGQTYSGNGTTTIVTPAADFFPGEEVEVVFTPAIRSGCSGDRIPAVLRYRVATTPSTGTFVGGDPENVAGAIVYLALAGVDGNGLLDMIFVDDHNIIVRTQQAPGTFVVHDVHPVLFVGRFAVGDVDGDGKLDMTIGSWSNWSVVVYTNQ